MKVGFIGAGTMGRPMAGHLIDGGHALFVHDLAPVPQALLEKGAKACASGKEVADAAEVIITMVPDTPQVEAALFGPGGVAEGLSAGKLVIDMSSISPLATKDFARKINQQGCDYLDAPVSGGEAGAKAARLTIMVGGPEAAFARARPLLQLLGQNITLVGSNGDGQTAKVANQIVVAMTIQAVGEALVFASKAGAEPGGDAVGAEQHGLDVGRVRQHHDDHLGLFGHLLGRSAGDAAAVQQLLRHGAAGPEVQLVAAHLQVLRHWPAHDAEPDEADFHLQSPIDAIRSWPSRGRC